jgi:O-acetyl-ADP-ribose deacetylase (regulator of RNase III)
MPFEIIQGDITRIQADAIVNAANPQLQMGGGVCGAIFMAAGPQKLQAVCYKLAPIHTGEAVITPGFALPARFVVHTAGPVYSRQPPEESKRLLASAYRSSLKLAYEHGCHSIAFPLISSGIYGYPRRDALEVATRTIRDFLETHDMDVKLVIFNRSDVQIPPGTLSAVDDWLQEHLPETQAVRSLSDTVAMDRLCESTLLQPSAPTSTFHPDFSAMFAKLDEPFDVYLMKLIDRRGMNDVQVYRRANLDRRLFSKIRSGKGYHPGKRTILALAVALKLTLEETEALLERAGYALSPADKFDVVMEYFLEHGPRDIDEINEVLFYYGLPLLGGS